MSLKNAELERFTFMAYHDLQEPIRTITGFSHVLERRFPPEWKAKEENYIQYIKQSALQMQQLIEDILAYSNLSKSSSLELYTDLNSVIQEVEFSLQDSIEEKQALIRWDNLPAIRGERGQWVIVFKNLILNGITYNRSETPRVSISCLEGGDDYVFEVQDNGIGIEPKHHQSVFELFKRLHNRNVYEGTGMGLAIVKKLVNQHGGEISLESEPGLGTTFSIRIPREPAKKRNGAPVMQEMVMVS